MDDALAQHLMTGQIQDLVDLDRSLSVYESFHLDKT